MVERPDSDTPERAGRKSAVSTARFWPLVVLAGGFAAFFALDLDDYVSLAGLKENHDILVHWVTAKGAVAVVVFMLGYAAAMAFSLPIGSVLTVTAGILFGVVAGTVYSVISATCGATILFLAARTSLGEVLHARAGPRLRRLEAGFQENAFSYLLVLRLVPIFPFWLINLAPALLGVRLRTFFTATVIGIVPGTFVYALFGAGLGGALEAGGRPTLEGVLSPTIIAALIGIALLALLPVLFKWWKGRKGSSG